MARDGRSELIAEAIDNFNFNNGEAEFTPGHSDNSFRFLAEDFIGLSFLKLVNHLGVIANKVSEKGSFAIGNLRFIPGPIMDDENSGFCLSVMENESQKYVISYTGVTDRSFSKMNLYELDHLNPENNYPRRYIASSSIHQMPGRPPRSHGHGALQTFGIFVDAMSTLRPVLGIPVNQQVKPLIADIDLKSPIRYNNALPEIIHEDGGLAGELALETVCHYQHALAKGIMRWARKTLLDTYRMCVERDLVWKKSYMNYNDLDDSSFAITIKDSSKIAMFHENISLICDHSAWVSVGNLSEDGTITKIELYPLHRITDRTLDFVKKVASNQIDRSPAASYDFVEDRLFTATSIDTTEVIDNFSFYLYHDHELVVEGNLYEVSSDGTVKTDFNDLNYHDDENEENYSLRP